MSNLNERIVNLMKEGSPAMRIEITKRPGGFVYFCLYYFSEFFKYRSAPFHYDFYQDCEDLIAGKISQAAWVAFGESAKTSIAKMFVVYCICLNLKKYINYDSYDRGNPEAALYDITNWLRTNKKIVSDFGRLYRKFKKKNKHLDPEDELDTMKRITSFITENGIKVEAFTTQESPRGRVFGNIRPDLYIIDDVENKKTIHSYPVMFKIKGHIDEIKRGLGPTGCILYLGNLISEDGVIAYIMESIRAAGKGRVRNIPVIKDNQIMWPDKYTFTDKQAAVLNEAIPNRDYWKVSLEEKRRFLTHRVFETEMMNNPAHGEDKVFDRETIERFMRNIREPIAEKAGFKLWAEYNPSHRYAIGGDTAKGIGRDSNASCLIDFSTIPNRVVGTYTNNKIAPDIFAHELARQGDMFGTCLLAPEKNNTGYATITKLKDIYDTNRIFVPMQDERVKEKLAEDYGWDTNAATKPEMIYGLKSAVEDGLLLIEDKVLLEELKYYGLRDLQLMRTVEGMTRHFDLLTAAAIAWAVRNYAKLGKGRKKVFVQAPHNPSTEYGG